jgi:hypothetical protein
VINEMHFMKTFMQVVGLTCLSALAAMAPVTSKAAVAYDFNPGTPLVGNQTDAAYSLGTVFSINQPILVTGLRVFDNGGDGLGGPVTVSIYAIGLSGTTITAGFRQVYADFSGTAQSYDAATGTRYQSVTPIQFSVGTFLVVANHMGTGTGASEVNYNEAVNGGDPEIVANTGGGLISFGNNYYNTDPSFASVSWAGAGGWAQDPSAYQPNYAAGNFDFTAVPEAHHFAMAGAGLMGLVYFGRSVLLRRKARA